MTEPEIIMQPGRLPSKGWGGGRPSLAERYADELAKIAADPGQWYHLLRYPEDFHKQTASKAALSLRRSCPDYEVVSRGRSVWVRYVGHGEEVED